MAAREDSAELLPTAYRAKDIAYGNQSKTESQILGGVGKPLPNCQIGHSLAVWTRR